MTWRALFVGMMIVLNSGCSGPEYTLEKAKSLELLKVRNISDRTWQTHIPINRYDGYPSMKRVWYGDKNVYYLYKKRKHGQGELPYILYGLTTKRVNQFDNIDQLKEIGLKSVKLEPLSKNRQYHAFIPELNLYVKAKLHRGYNIGYAVLDDFYDVAFEITDRYNEDSDAQSLLKSYQAKQKALKAQKEVMKFVAWLDRQGGGYRLQDLIDPKRSEWHSQENHPDRLEGKGEVKLRFKDDTYVDYALIQGTFHDGKPVASVTIEVKSSYCVERFIVCVKYYTDTYRKRVTPSEVKRAIQEGMKQTESGVKEKVRAYRQRSYASHSASSVSSASRAPSGDTEFDVVLKCRSYYDIKHITIRRRADGYGSGLKAWADQNGEALCRRYAPKGYTQYDGVYNIKRR